MGNGSSRASVDYYPSLPPVPLRAQSIHIPPQHVLPPQYHPGSYNSHSANSYDMSRKRKPWYSFSRRKDRHRTQELWYRPFVSPEGPVIPPPPGFLYDQWGHQPILVPRPVLNEPPQFSGYVPAVVPDVMPRPGSRSRQSHRHTSRPQQPSYLPPMMPQPQVQSQSSSSMASPDSTGSPPFKPFAPLPRSRQQRPPTPPQNIMTMSPYKNSFQHLMHPSPQTRTRVMEILTNPEKTNIQIAREEWKKRDEEREKELKEKREQRERLLNGNIPIPVPVVNTMPLDPRFMKKKKPRKSLFGSIRSAFARRGGGGTYSNAGSSGTHPSMPTFLQPVVPLRTPSPVPSATHLVANSVAMPTPAVIPSPFLPQPIGSTTPPFSPENPNFIEVTTTNKYAALLPMSSYPVSYPNTDPSKAGRWPTAAHFYLASRFFEVRSDRVKHIQQTPSLDEVLRLIHSTWNDGMMREDWETTKHKMLEEIMYLMFYQHPTLRHLLLETGDLPIICNVQHHVLQGTSFGDILVRVRDRLRRNE